MIKPVTTLRCCPGWRVVDVQMNGRVLAGGSFRVEATD